MSTFPVLKTGAVLQVPTSRTFEFSTHVVNFVDGSEQRFRSYSQSYRRWIVKFDFLDDTELRNIREFVERQNGAAGVFSFTDPWDGTVYATCSIEGNTLTDGLAGPFECRSSLTIREHKS